MRRAKQAPLTAAGFEAPSHESVRSAFDLAEDRFDGLTSLFVYRTPLSRAQFLFHFLLGRCVLRENTLR